MASTMQSTEFAGAGGRERTSLGIAMTGSLGEALSGVAVIVLAILALAGVLPAMLTAIATIAAGAALMFAGGAVAARYAGIRCQFEQETSAEVEMGSTISAETLGGVAGVVLGILALIGLVPGVLTAAAVIVFGGSIIVGSAALAELSALQHGPTRAARQVMLGASGSQALVGLAGVVLGILALIGVGEAGYAPTLVLVGLLVVGAGVLLGGGALGSRVMHLLSH